MERVKTPGDPRTQSRDPQGNLAKNGGGTREPLRKGALTLRIGNGVNPENAGIWGAFLSLETVKHPFRRHNWGEKNFSLFKRGGGAKKLCPPLRKNLGDFSRGEPIPPGGWSHYSLLWRGLFCKKEANLFFFSGRQNNTGAWHNPYLHVKDIIRPAFPPLGRWAK